MTDIPKEVLDILPPAEWAALWFSDVLVLISPEHPVMIANRIEGRWQVVAIDPLKFVQPSPVTFHRQRIFWSTTPGLSEKDENAAPPT